MKAINRLNQLAEVKEGEPEGTPIQYQVGPCLVFCAYSQKRRLWVGFLVDTRSTDLDEETGLPLPAGQVEDTNLDNVLSQLRTAACFLYSGEG